MSALLRQFVAAGRLHVVTACPGSVVRDKEFYFGDAAAHRFRVPVPGVPFTLRALFILTVAGIALSSVERAVADAPDDADSERWIVEQSRAWAEQSCGKGWVLSDILAPDFRGTSPKGTRYDKPREAPEFDPGTVWHTDCRLLEAEVRFFGPDLAVVYGAESKVVPLADGGEERRCLVWTDTWLRRDGEWRVIAAQDNRVECPAE